MYNLIYQLKDKELGTGLMSINMEKTYPGLFKAYDVKSQELPEKDRIWQIQNPYLYNLPNCSRARDYVFTRVAFAKEYVGKKMTNGFSYLNRHRTTYNYFLPTIYGSDFSISEVPSVGYYARDCRIQSNLRFAKFLLTLPKGTPVVTMGTKELIEDKIPPHVEWFHTYDRNVFWESCSHYFYYRCSDIEDPLPHTVLEAIQSLHRIISPMNPNRNFHDGIDDLLSCVEYDTEFLPQNIGDYSDYLDPKNWTRFMQRVSDNGFAIDYPVHRRTFREWIEENL